jgi:hypothetical protein
MQTPAAPNKVLNSVVIPASADTISVAIRPLRTKSDISPPFIRAQAAPAKIARKIPRARRPWNNPTKRVMALSHGAAVPAIAEVEQSKTAINTNEIVFMFFMVEFISLDVFE